MLIDKTIKKYENILSILEENNARSDNEKWALDDTYDYETDIKNTKQFIKDLKILAHGSQMPQQIYWKDDMMLECPHCGHVYDTRAYLNITEVDNECYKCGGKYDVELWACGFEQRCIKR